MKTICRENPFKTQRLTIREFCPNDAPFVLRLLNDESFIKYIGDKQVRNIDDAKQYLINGPIASYQKFGHGLYLVLANCLGDSVHINDANTPIGMCGLLKRDELTEPDLGFAFLPEYCSQGFATEASRCVMDAFFERGYANRVLAITLPHNKASNHLLLKLGFLSVGTVMIYDGVNNLYQYDKN